MQRLGTPGTQLGDWVEDPVFLFESAPMSGLFLLAPWAGSSFEIVSRANQVPTCKFDISLANLPGEDSNSQELLDWLVRGLGGAALKPDEELLNGRRIQIRTDSGQPWDDWVLFEWFMERLELTFSGSSDRRPRGLTGFATNTIIAADREMSQQMWGQWRRSRAAEMQRLYPGEGGSLTTKDTCTRVAVPMIFNPGGRPNCHPDPLEFRDGSKVYIPCDPDDSGALWWTVAKMLWYINWASQQPPPPGVSDLDVDGTGRYDQIYESRQESPLQRQYFWTSFRLWNVNLYELVGSEGDGGGTLLEAEPDNGESGDMGLTAWLRAPADIAIEGMSVLEAYTYLCDRSGTSWSVEHRFAPNGDLYTGLIFSVRGHLDEGEEVPELRTRRPGH